MEPVYWIDIFSISVLFGLTVLIASGAIMLGQFFGTKIKALTGNKDSIGSVVGATLAFWLSCLPSLLIWPPTGLITART
jgi:hypothetical protein